MSLTERARQVQEHQRIENVRRARPKHPKGFEPGLDTEKGEIAGRFEKPLKEGEYEDAFRYLLEEWGFDPEEFSIEDDRVEVRTWDAHYGKENPPRRFWYYKAKVIRRRKPEDVSDLVKMIRSKRPIKKKTFDGDRAFAVLNADWQLGKRDGRGTEFTVQAIVDTIPDITKRYKDLRKMGHKINELHIYNLGDLVEGCVGHYPMQTFYVELSRREQVRLAREMLTKQIMAWADDFERVLVVGVPGNHGEYRNEDGKTFTNLGDNDDVALVEQVAEAFDLAGKVGSRYEHVKFLIPENQMSFTLDVHGTIVGLTHGHVANSRAASGKSLSHTKLWDWWYGQSMGRQPVADADLLITGHYHYLSLFRQGTRTALQAPPLDDGSEWFVDINGMGSHAAVASLLIGGGTDEGNAGWSDLYVTERV